MTTAPWSDEEFLGYVDLHCETDQHLFSREHVQRLLRLAGYVSHAPDWPAFIGIDRFEGHRYVERARFFLRNNVRFDEDGNLAE